MAAYRNRRPQRRDQQSTGWASKTAANSWFSTNRISAPNQGLHTHYSPTAVQATTVRTTAGTTKQPGLCTKVRYVAESAHFVLWLAY